MWAGDVELIEWRGQKAWVWSSELDKPGTVGISAILALGEWRQEDRELVTGLQNSVLVKEDVNDQSPILSLCLSVCLLVLPVFAVKLKCRYSSHRIKSRNGLQGFYSEFKLLILHHRKRPKASVIAQRLWLRPPALLISCGELSISLNFKNVCGCSNLFFPRAIISQNQLTAYKNIFILSR